MRKLLLLVGVLALVPLVVAGDHMLTNVKPTSVTSTDSPIDLPVLRHRDFGENTVPQPALPATPAPASQIAKPAQPATPALPPGTTMGPTANPNDDPCDGFENIDARERCRENAADRRERDFERDHNTPTPFPTHTPH